MPVVGQLHRLAEFLPVEAEVEFQPPRVCKVLRGLSEKKSESDSLAPCVKKRQKSTDQALRK